MDTKPVNDPWIDLAEQAMLASASAAVPGKFLVDVIPWLKYIPEWFPGAGFQRQAREWKELWARFRVAPFLAAEENIVSGCFTINLLLFVNIGGSIKAKGGGQHSFVSSSLDSINDKHDVEGQKSIIQDVAVSFLAGTVSLSFLGV